MESSGLSLGCFSYSILSPVGLAPGLQLQNQDPKVETPPGHLSLCVPHISSSLKTASLTLFSSAFRGASLGVHLVIKTYDPSSSPPTPPMSLVKPGGSAVAISSHCKLALCSHTSTPLHLPGTLFLEIRLKASPPALNTELAPLSS